MQQFAMRRALAPLGALLLLTQAAIAQASPPAAVVPDADAGYEWEIVSTASRKMLELQRETETCVVDAVPRFLTLVASAYKTKPPLMYGAMSFAGKRMPGRGPVNVSTFPTMYHVTSATSFYKYNVSDNWKKFAAAKLSKERGTAVDWNSSEVFAVWQDAVTDGQDMPKDMVLPDSVAMRALSWVTPDKRMIMASAATRAQGTDKFFAACHILSLAPEWYPAGLVNMNYNALNTGIVRPVSFDGMLSPLWVQRPPNRPAATGGDVLEAFNKNEIRVSALGPIQSYMVTLEMTAALKNSPSVNDYSLDLNKVAHGSDAATERLGKEETSIVREVRQSRRAADADFAGVPYQKVPFAASPQCAPNPTQKRKKHAMLSIPTGGSDFSTLEALETEMKIWAAGGFVQNRGQRFPAERFEQEITQSAQAARTIIAAATELLRRSDDPAVLAMVAQLGNGNSYRPFYVALLDRLAGRPRPLPRGAGIRGKTLEADLMIRLEDALLAQDEKLFKRAYARAGSAHRPDIRLAMLLDSGSSDELVAALAAAATMPTIDPWLAARAGWAIALANPSRLIAAAESAAALPPAARRLFVAAAQAAAGDWFAIHASELRRLAALQ